jgi:hypothetical protein
MRTVQRDAARPVGRGKEPVDQLNIEPGLTGADG